MTEPCHFLPFPRTTVHPGQCITIVAHPQREGRLIGITFDPECVEHLQLTDLRSGQCTLFGTTGPIPAAFLLTRAERFSPVSYGPWENTVAADVMNSGPEEINVRGAFLIEPQDLERSQELKTALSEIETLKVLLQRSNDRVADLLILNDRLTRVKT